MRGSACLAMFVANRMGFYTGLCLIALGSGGIKPCVAAFVGDQFDQTNKHRAKVVFDAFYWIINFGSFFASLLMPIFLGRSGRAVAFGIPGALMFIATVILWLGRKQYVLVPPAPPNPHSFLRVRASGGFGMPAIILAVNRRCHGLGSFLLVPKFGFVIAVCSALVALIAFGGLGVWLQLDGVRGQHPDEAVEGVRAVLARARALLPRHAVLVALRPKSVDVGLAGRCDDRSRVGSSPRRCRRSIRCSSCC